MAFAENLAQIRARGHHYLVAGRPPERREHQEAFEDETGWTEILRTPSPRNPGQTKTRVFIKRAVSGAEVHILCRSDGRRAKDRAIRDTHEQRFLRDLTKLQARVARGRLRAPAKIHQALGRLKERYPRVARYYALAYDDADARGDRDARTRTCRPGRSASTAPTCSGRIGRTSARTRSGGSTSC